MFYACLTVFLLSSHGIQTNNLSYFYLSCNTQPHMQKKFARLFLIVIV